MASAASRSAAPSRASWRSRDAARARGVRSEPKGEGVQSAAFADALLCESFACVFGLSALAFARRVFRFMVLDPRGGMREVFFHIARLYVGASCPLRVCDLRVTF